MLKFCIRLLLKNVYRRVLGIFFYYQLIRSWFYNTFDFVLVKSTKTLMKREITIISFVTVCSCHVTYAFRSESTLYSCLNVKEFLARSRREIWSLSECTLNHLAILVWPNGWVFIYQISGSGFESSCSHLSPLYLYYLLNSESVLFFKFVFRLFALSLKENFTLIHDIWL